MSDKAQTGSVRRRAGLAHDLAQQLRHRLTRDIWRTLNHRFPDLGEGNPDELVDACDAIIERHGAFVGLASEGLSHTSGLRFLDLGLAVERASLSLQTARQMVPGSANAVDLSVLLDLCDCLGTCRGRYMAIPTIAPVLDMVLLDPVHPRGFAFQLARIERHLGALPPLREDGLPEPALVAAHSLRCAVEAAAAEKLTPAVLDGWLAMLWQLSETLSRAYFLQQEARGKATQATRFLA